MNALLLLLIDSMKSLHFFLLLFTGGISQWVGSNG